MADERDARDRPGAPPRRTPFPHDPPVVEGEDDSPRQPTLPRDEGYSPEPGARPGERRAFRILALAWIPAAIVVGFVVWAIFH
jgi:hypothetical protein